MTEKNGVERSTATDVLRRMLDECGVEHYDGTERTLWGYEQTGEDTGIYRFAASEISGGFLQFDMFRIAPEQAIAATLGATDAKPTQVESSGTCEADETDTWECVRDDLGGYGKTMTVHVMKCTECGHVYEHVNGDYEYCPRCGRRRRDVEE